jgi:hypothetical protein
MTTPAIVAVLKLAQAEFDVMHAVCDRAEIPREHDGEKLSCAQRVNAMEICLAQLREKYTGDVLGSLQ